MTYDTKRDDMIEVYQRNRKRSIQWRSKEKGFEVNKQNHAIFRKI